MFHFRSFPENAQSEKSDFALENDRPEGYNPITSGEPKVTQISKHNAVKLSHSPQANWKRFTMLCRYAAEQAEVGGKETVS